jgi:hypothetical protein
MAHRWSLLPIIVATLLAACATTKNTSAPGFDFPPAVGPPPEPDYPVTTEISVQTPWIDVPGSGSLQARRSERYRRVADGSCTWATCANPGWDLIELRIEQRIRPNEDSGS